MEIVKTEGLVAAPPTPMNADGSLRLERVDRLAEMLPRNGVVGVFPCGSTGEAMSLTTQERMDVAARWVRAAPKGFRVLVHAGHTSIRDCKALAEHAQKIGAFGVGAFAPCYFKPRGVPDLTDFLAEVAAAAPKLPFYYYHIPSMTGVCVSMVELFRHAARRIPNLAGVKFTHTDLMDLRLAMDAEDGRYDVLFGCDEQLLCGLALGVRAAIGSTYSFAAPLYVDLMKAFDRGDLAAALDLQRKSMRMVACLLNRPPGTMPHIKATMKFVGTDCGPVRPPLVNLSDEQLAAYRAELEKVGFFHFCNR